MSGYRQLKQQIKFSLNNLGAENEHHVFEAICRNFARRRLGLNILPATGPVSSGGDQGKDFETYTVLPEVVPFLQDGKNVLAKKAAFACTIQKDKIADKVKSDLKKIAETDDEPEIVYFFSVRDVPISSRHKLQSWARKEHSLQLEVFDGEALSEELASNDLFWIAEEFLHVPAEVFPTVEDADYLPLKEKWDEAAPTTENYADFDEIKGLARRALFDEQLAQDLPFWIQKLQEFLAISDLKASFKRKVLYEVVVLRMRGMRDLTGWEHFVHDYFDAADSFHYQLEAKDAQIVLQYAYGASVRGAASFSDGDLRKWWDTIERYVESELHKEYPPHIQAVLFDLNAHLLLTHPDQRDIEDALDQWLKAAAVMEKTPLFPLEEFSLTLTGMVPLLGDRPKFQELVELIDRLLAERVGQFAVADNCRERALEYKKKGDLVRALREFHKAKINWFANETLRGSLLSSLLISQIYSELGLLYAAKYYAMTTIFIAGRSPEDETKTLIPQAFVRFIEIDYENGEWAHFFEHAELCLRSLGVFAASSGDEISATIYEKVLFYSATLSALIHELENGPLYQYASGRIAKWNIRELSESHLPMALECWTKIDTGELIGKVKSEFHGLPFSDVGPKRECRWNANGVSWHFIWRNGLETNALAEQLIAVTQIVSAEIADKDFYLLNVGVDVEIDFGGNFDVKARPSNFSSNWAVTLPEQKPTDRDDAETRHMKTLAIAITLLSSVSLLPDEKVHERIAALFQSGLTSKAFSGNTYETVYVELTPEDLYERLVPLARPEYLQSIELELRQHDCLAWRDGVVDEYDDDEEKSRIENRYENAVVPIRRTLEKLKTHEPFLSGVKQLRSENWKDWHLLIAISNIAANYRVAGRGYEDIAEMKKIFMEEMNTEETDASISVPLLEFNLDAMRNALGTSFFSTLALVGLQLKSQTPSAEAVERFLSTRLSYWNNDVDHEDFFDV